jgi:hypothetical protein
MKKFAPGFLLVTLLSVTALAQNAQVQTQDIETRSLTITLPENKLSIPIQLLAALMRRRSTR